jgi:hypothetical protein
MRDLDLRRQPGKGAQNRKKSLVMALSRNVDELRGIAGFRLT